MSEIHSADMKRLVGVLGDMKKELTLLRKEVEKITGPPKTLNQPPRVEYRDDKSGKDSSEREFR